MPHADMAMMPPLQSPAYYPSSHMNPMSQPQPNMMPGMYSIPPNRPGLSFSSAPMVPSYPYGPQNGPVMPPQPYMRNTFHQNRGFPINYPQMMPNYGNPGFEANRIKNYNQHPEAPIVKK